MPHLIFSGVKKEDVKKLSKSIQKELAIICDTTEDNFIFDYLEGDWYLGGEPMKKYPLIEIKMFDRGRDVEEAIFEEVSDKLQELNYTDIEVYFIHLDRKSYYF